MKEHSLEYCFLNPDSLNWLKTTELAGRTCYKSEDRIKAGSEIPFNNMLCNTFKHLSVMEHSLIVVWFRGSRGFTHEMVRHRHCSFSQESTRYCNYGKNNNGLNVLPPTQYTHLEGHMKKQMVQKNIELPEEEFLENLQRASELFANAFDVAYSHYMELLKLNVPVQLARDVLPIGTKADIVVSGNYRTWVEFLRQRLAPQAHPIMRAMMTPVARELKKRVPVIFDSLELLDEPEMLKYASEITLQEYYDRIGAGEIEELKPETID